MTVLIYAMIYVGAAIMVYNIVRYYGFMRKMTTLSDQNSTRIIVAIPLMLLIAFFFGYLTVALIGNPDFVIAGILFGGSLFVLIVLGIIYNIVDLLFDSISHTNSLYEQTKKNLESLTKDCLAVFHVNLTKDLVEDRKGTNLYETDFKATSYTELLSSRREHVINTPENSTHAGLFSREHLLELFEKGETSIEETLFCHLNDGQLAFVNLKASLVARPSTGDVLAFIVETLCNEEVVNDTLLNKALIEQYDMICYLVEGRYGVIIGEDSGTKRGSIFPRQKNGEYSDYLADQVAPVIYGPPEETIRAVSSLGLIRIERELAVHEPYESNITIMVDGETFHKRFVFYVVDAEAHFYLLLKSDTTELIREEKKRAERLEEALEEARYASRAKTIFLANMSHDIRTPMNAIVGYTNFARKSSDPVQIHEYLDKIDASSKYLLALINDVLEMSRIESGKLDLQLQPTNLLVLFEEMHAMFEAQMAGKGIDFTVDTSKVRNPYVLCDEVRLDRLILNLVSNAYKFTPEGGSVNVTIAQLADAEGGCAPYELRVKDSGIGMSPEFASKVFDAFERERNTTASGIQGTGLGMAITKRIVDAMGGTIHVDTAPGAGTEFILNLNLQLQDQAEIDAYEQARITSSTSNAHADDASEGIDFKNMRILLAEDNEINLEIATIIFEDLGFEVETAKDGKQALDLLVSSGPGHFDAVVTDIQMPVMDGYEEARAIRSLDDPQLSRTPIIAMSANAFAEDIQEGLDAGMDSYLSKPIDIDSVITTMTSVLKAARNHRE